MSTTTDHQHESAPRWLWGLGLALGALLFAFLLGLDGTVTGGALRHLEHGSLDARFVAREWLKPTDASDDIVILTIDDWGIEEFEYPDLAEGFNLDFTLPWPWPRALYGFATQLLAQAGARAVFFDFLFTGPSVHESLQQPDDTEFARMAADAGNVYFPLLFQEPASDAADDGAGRLRGSRLLDQLLERFPEGKLEQAAIETSHGPGDGLTSYDGVEVPVRTLAEAARGFGAVQAVIDPDGIVRRVELLARFRGRVYPAISLVLAAELLGEEIGWDPSGPWVTLGERRIPVDDEGRMLASWHGGAGTYTTYPLHMLIVRALSGEPDLDLARERFEGKTVLVGSSALALFDLKANPFGAYYPGVEAHATVLDNILNEEFVHRPRAGTRWAVTALLFVAAGLALTRRQGAGRITALFVAFLGFYVGAAFALFTLRSVWIDLAVPCGGLVLLFGAAQAFQYFTEGRQKREMRSTFQRYLPPAVVNEVLKLPADELKLGGDRRELTVYFSDIAGFTSISERLAPEELVSLLNEYLGAMSDVITAHQGTLDKYIGDCVMAFWGAPLPVENGALEACYAALECQARTVELNRGFRERGLPEIHARIGVNTGPMLVGNMGSDRHFAFTVMGDAVNLASRLEGANKQYGTKIMLGPGTEAQAREGIEVRELDLLRVKGKDEPVAVFELLGRRGELSEAQERLRAEWGKALAAYRARDWEAATAGFEACLRLDAADGPSQTYLDRCVTYRESPPSADWDGVYAMRTK